MNQPLAPSPSPYRTVVITGGNAGLGFHCAQALLRDTEAPWHIILACRDPERAQNAVKRLRRLAAGGSKARVEAMSLNLASLASIRAFAQVISERLERDDLPPLQGLVCNAGSQSAATMSFTADGFETTFGVNHLGHFLLVNLLLSKLAPSARIAVVASGAHDPKQKPGMVAPAWNATAALARGELGEAARNDAGVKGGQRRYTTSKLANVFFTYELARRLTPGVTVNAFDPGLMPGTGLAREYSAPLRWLWNSVLPRVIPLLRRVLSPNIHTPAESGAALARLITERDLEGVSGKYFEGSREIRSSVESYDLRLAAELWQGSALLTGVPTEALVSSIAA